MTDRPIRLAQKIGTVSRTGWLMILSGLPSPVPSPLRQRHLDGRAVVDDLLALHRHPADVDVVADARHRLLVGHAVEPLDDLRARGTQPEDEATVGDEVETRCGLRHAGGGAREHVEDRRADLDRVGLRREVADLGHGVEAVGLGHPHDVEAGLFQLDHLVHVGVEVAQ